MRMSIYQLTSFEVLLSGNMISCTTIFFFCNLLLLAYPSSALPLCTDQRAPLVSVETLSFCSYNGSICCDSTKDLQLQKQFLAMNITNSNCSALVKSVLCATCDPFSGELYKAAAGTRSVPVLCSSSPSVNSSSLTQITSFCSNLWDTCQDIPILNSPFAASLQGGAGVPSNSSASKLTDLWPSKNDFCKSLGGTSGDGSICFDGGPVKLVDNETIEPPNGMCLEKISDGGYLNMVPHPDGSNRVFLADQPGKIWLATVPEQGSGQTLGLDKSKPFMDLTDLVHYDSVFGMMGLAFHPNFTHNGRFFASYNCDKVKFPGCSGTCACNSAVNCDPSKIVSTGTGQPCQYHSVISEFTANGSASAPSLATSAKPSEVRRIFTIGLPFTNNHGGQILFGPEDGYLYFMMGDGGGKSDPYSFAQNKKSVLGKVMRLDINNIPSAQEIQNLGLWGNYSIPSDNPSSEDKELVPEIWSMGFRNPWRCSFDVEKPSYFICSDIGQDLYEEVNLISKEGNYGWGVYEGPYFSTASQNLKANMSFNSTYPIFPVLGYSHSDVNKKEGSAAISGGYVYRATADPCMYGSYLFADLYATAAWAGIESPKGSGNFTKYNLTFSCAKDSPMQCDSIPDSQLPSIGYIFSSGEDNRKDVFLLTSKGVYRIVAPSRCNYICAKENVTVVNNPASNPPPKSGNERTKSQSWMTSLFIVMYLLAFLL